MNGLKSYSFRRLLRLGIQTVIVAINLVRLWSPFTGFHLPFLDTISSFRRFDNAITDRIRTEIASGIPENIIELMDTLDPQERLAHVIGEQLKLTADIPKQYIAKAPPRGGEVGLVIDDAIVNPDTTIAQGRINSLYNANILEFIEQSIIRHGKCRILEVGAGYGALATALHSLYPGRLEYIVVELPNILWNAVCYMGAVGDPCLIGPDQKFPETFETALMSNYLIEEYRDDMGPVDLAINTMSFIEMSETQVRYYRDLMNDLLRSDGWCFVEGTPTKPHHVNCDLLFSETMPNRVDVPQEPAYCGGVYSTTWRKEEPV